MKGILELELGSVQAKRASPNGDSVRKKRVPLGTTQKSEGVSPKLPSQ